MKAPNSAPAIPIVHAFLKCGGAGKWTDSRSVAGYIKTHYKGWSRLPLSRVQNAVVRVVEGDIRLRRVLGGQWAFEKKESASESTKYRVAFLGRL